MGREGECVTGGQGGYVRVERQRYANINDLRVVNFFVVYFIYLAPSVPLKGGEIGEKLFYLRNTTRE